MWHINFNVFYFDPSYSPLENGVNTVVKVAETVLWGFYRFFRSKTDCFDDILLRKPSAEILIFKQGLLGKEGIAMLCYFSNIDNNRFEISISFLSSINHFCKAENSQSNLLLFQTRRYLNKKECCWQVASMWYTCAYFDIN